MNWGPSADVGDWIVLTQRTPSSFTDHLMGGGLSAGSRGIVTARTGSRVTADVDTGFGTCQVTLDIASCRLIRRGGGDAGFRKRVRIKTRIRVGFAIALAAPWVYYILRYRIELGTFDGLIPWLLEGTVSSIGDWFVLMLANPVQTLLYAVIVGLIGRFTWGRR